MLEAHNGLVCLHIQATCWIVCKGCSSLSLAFVVLHGSLEAREAKHTLQTSQIRPEQDQMQDTHSIGGMGLGAKVHQLIGCNLDTRGESGTGQRIREM